MLRIILVIVGTLIGAGFASGREIYLFFVRYGVEGLFGIILTAISTSFIIYRVLSLVKTYEIINYNKLLERINWRHPRIDIFINLVINIFLLMSFYIMVAGFSSYIEQSYKVPMYMSAILFVIICFFIFKKNVQGVIKANEVLVPILIALLLYFGIRNIGNAISDFQNINNIIVDKNSGWLISSILYTSYNSIILVPVLISLREYISSKKDIIKISLISGIMIIVFAFLIFGLLLRNTYFISQMEMPLAEVSIELGDVFKYIYGIIMIISIFTSAVSAGYSFIKNVCKKEKNEGLIIASICISAILISNFGFSKLVENLYPLFGILGLSQIFLLFKKTA